MSYQLDDPEIIRETLPDRACFTELSKTKLDVFHRYLPPNAAKATESASRWPSTAHLEELAMLRESRLRGAKLAAAERRTHLSCAPEPTGAIATHTEI